MDLIIVGKQIYKLFLVIFIILFGCKIEQKQSNKKENSITSVLIEKEQSTLFIEGDNVWVRDNPRKGKVIIKLNEGDRCTIIDTSKVDTIRGCIDYWYEIKHKDTIGWVFGSQTNIKSKSSKKTQLFLKQMETFVSALKTKNFKIINAFIFPKEPIHCVLGTSGSDYLRTTITYDLKKTSEEYYDVKELLDTLSSYAMAKHLILHTNITEPRTSNFYLKRGIYYQELNNGNHSISNWEKWQLEHDMVTQGNNNLSTEYPKYIQREKQVKFRLVIAFNNMGNDDNPYYQFYFYFRQGKWYLSGIYHPYMS